MRNREVDLHDFEYEVMFLCCLVVAVSNSLEAEFLEFLHVPTISSRILWYLWLPEDPSLLFPWVVDSCVLLQAERFLGRCDQSGFITIISGYLRGFATSKANKAAAFPSLHSNR